MSQMEVESLQESRRGSLAENQTTLKSDIPLKERFFRYFQHEITGTQPNEVGQVMGAG